MELERISVLLAEQRDALDHLDVKSLSVFGSVARGESGAESDVDILVEFHGKATFDRYMECKFLLQDLLKARVDLVTTKALRPEMRPTVEKEAVRVA
jgi:predicted nucleotidyltransferase